MTTLARCCLCGFVILTYWCNTVSAQVVDIPDPNLESAIREELNLPDEIPLTQQEMLRLAQLETQEKQIEDLTGLEGATNLKKLSLPHNNITDLSPLSDLSGLEILYLWGNPISNISPIAGLIQLQRLDFGGCQVSDINPLANLTQLTYLTLHYNFRIIDITPLINLIQLTELRLSRNRIADITPLANLTQLITLQLSHNRIVDISPLANLTQLTDLTLANNAITDFSPLFGLNSINIDIDIHKLQELASVDVNIPDPNLERAIREEIGLLADRPVTQLVMNQLTGLDAGNSQIGDLTGLEHATNLKWIDLHQNNISDLKPLADLTHLERLSLWGNPISDLSPIANLIQLRGLDLGGCDVSDITPLANLTQLEWLTLHWNHLIEDITPLANLTRLTDLRLSGNRIMNVSPLANLTMLEELRIDNNQIIDYSPLDGLSLTLFERDHICELPAFPIDDRIENRSFPSIFQAWGGIREHPTLSREDRIAQHDLHWHGLPFGLRWVTTDEGQMLTGNIKRAKAQRDELISKNPNMIFLAEIRYRDAFLDGFKYPEDYPYWLRDENGNLVKAWRDRAGLQIYLLDFTNPDFQDVIVQQAVAVSKCGLYDGIVFDWWHEGIVTLSEWDNWSNQYSTVEAELEARLSIVQRIREQVRDDFLIIGNTNRRKIPVTAPYINGGFMETGRDYDGGYTHEGLAEIESSLFWLDQYLRSPRVNCLEGWGIIQEDPDSPTNKRFMRAITTLSLTHSDGYVIYFAGGALYRSHIWHDFWDADLGRPIGEKAIAYQDIEGLFVREFDNGWAVYNRSGQAQTITLPASTIPVSDRSNNAASQTHILPDLDGEIYLTTKSFADVNGDGKVNVLDLIQVANGLGKSAPDPNGDGVVNILDLVFVVQQFSQ